jgi:transmembrane sensor
MKINRNELRYRELAKKWLDGTITPEEQKEFAAWYNSGQDQPIEIPAGFAISEGVQSERLLAKIKATAGIETKSARIVPLYWRYVAAAVAVLLFTFIGSELLKPAKKQLLVSKINNGRYKNDIAPASNKVILTLANGQQVIIGRQNGILARQGKTQISQTADGKIVYNSSAATENTFNMISVPKGARQLVVLPDGSRAWLNAQSSLRYPVSFNGTERKVELTGEAYFEVAFNGKQPFKVQTSRAMIEDLGTHFDVMDYKNEDEQKTTLFEGAVRVDADRINKVMAPGQQASVTGRKIIINNNADLEGVLAWKNNEFEFDDADLQSIMRQLERWYDIQVNYEKIPLTHFSGTISRSSNLSAVLNMLELTGGIKFEISGDTISVLK